MTEDDDPSLTPEECAAVILRVLVEPQWGNGSIVETQKMGDKKASEVVVRDVQMEQLYPTNLPAPRFLIQSREKLAKQLQESGMRV